jgi:hypothetical protein
VRRNLPAITLGLSAEQPDDYWRDIDHRFAITRHEGIQVDQVRNALWRLINYTGDDHPAITMPYQDDPLQILVPKQADDILDLGI